MKLMLMKNPIFATYYSNILDISEKLDIEEKYYRIGGIRATTFLVKKKSSPLLLELEEISIFPGRKNVGLFYFLLHGK